MSLLRSIAIICLIIGVVALIVPGVPGAGFLRLGIVLAIIVAIVEIMTGRRT